nr:glycerate kinase [Solihabitans fulvus]
MSAHVLVAPDKFKGSLTAAEAAAAVARGLGRVAPDVPVRCLPVADGGDGTVDAAVAAGYRRVERTVTGPVGRPVTAAFAVREGTAVVEVAAASGLARLAEGERAPLTATSAGTGELVRAALDLGCERIVLGVGGSACTDGGAGLLAALGADLTGVEAPGGAALRNARELNLSTMDIRLEATEFILASDVDNPLLGPHGAAAIYAPQKGATPADVEVLEESLSRWASVVAAATGRDLADAPSAGAAGGIGFAALAVLGARHRPGIEMLLDLVGFAEAMTGARLVITGEGSLDEQTLRGKAPAGVASAARAAGIPVVAVAGRCLLGPDALRAAGIAGAYSLTDLEPDITRCLAQAADLLERLAESIARDWL